MHPPNTTVVSVSRGLSHLSLSTVIVAISGWVSLVAAARLLGPSTYASFSVLWGLFFASTGLMFGIQQEITREMSEPPKAPTDEPRAPFIVVRAFMMGLIIVTILTCSFSIWMPGRNQNNTAELLAGLVAGLLALSVHSAIIGILAGNRDFPLIALLLSIAALVRLVAVLTVLIVGMNSGFWMISIASGSFAWVLLSPFVRIRGALTARSTSPLQSFTFRSVSVMTSAGCGGLMSAGFPFMVGLFSSQSLGSSEGVFLAAVVLTRTPLMLPLNTVQLVLLRHLTERRDDIFRALRPIILIGAGVTVIAVVVATLIGPALLSIVFGHEYQLNGFLLGALTLGSCALAFLTLTGTAVLACNLHKASTAGWIVALLGTCVILASGNGIEFRGTIALILGPTLGVVWHIVSLVRSRIPSEKISRWD